MYTTHDSYILQQKTIFKTLITDAPQNDKKIQQAQKYFFLFVLDLVQVVHGVNAQEVTDQAKDYCQVNHFLSIDDLVTEMFLCLCRWDHTDRIIISNYIQR